MKKSAQELRTLILNGEPDIGQVLDVAVRVDGSWQKCYGHNSMNSMVFVISAVTGYVLDYVVKTKFCDLCKGNPFASDQWKEFHKNDCCINHTGSSGLMEVEKFIEMFLRSIEKYNLQYVTYVADGDSRASGSVKKAVEEKFSDQYPLHKEDCIGHIQKRMGIALRNYKNKSKGSKLNGSKRVGGTGRVTDSTIERMQTYFVYTIRNNKGNTEEIQKTIWVIYYHMILGPESESNDE